MKSIVIHAPQDLRIEEHTIAEPAADEVQVRIQKGGVCGSDLHYYNHGGFGSVRLKEPMVLGHEVAGHIEAVGANVTGFSVGELVAVSPSRPCDQCQYCQNAQHNHCLAMRFYGSAMPFPHIQGAFRQQLNAKAVHCVKADALSAAEAAMAEPVAVVLHAAQRAGQLLGKRVLITGSGPIGVIAVMVARRAGAAEIVVTDLSDAALSHAEKAGANHTLNTGIDVDALQPYTDNKGYFDVLFECSGAQAALAAALTAMRPGGIVMQLGLGGDMSIPMMTLTAKELQLRGSFRFHTEFATAVELMQQGLLDVKPLITHTLPLAQMQQAFETAVDRSVAMKVQIDFA